MKRGTYKRTVIAGDFHVSAHDPHAFKLFIKFLRWYKPKTLIINGDFLDCYTISRFDKSPMNRETLQEEINAGKALLLKIAAATPGCKRIYVFGNHENRLEKYMMRNARELYGIFTLQDLLDVNGQYEFINSTLDDNYYQLGELYVGHWNRVSKHSAYTVKNIMADRQVSIVQSHTHRAGMYMQTGLGGFIEGWEIGCMCDRKPEYCVRPNWQQGFLVIDPVFGGRNFQATFTKIFHKHGMCFCGYAGKTFAIKEVDDEV